MSSIPVYKFGIHSGEERMVPGNERSGMVSFFGCHLACNFCYTPETSVYRLGEKYSPAQFQKQLENLIAQGARNLNLISPTHVWGAIESVLESVRNRHEVPIVLKVSGYETPALVERMIRVADFFVPDYKVYSSEVAKSVGLPPSYGLVAGNAVERMAKAKPTLVRHLMMPGWEADSELVVKDLAAREFRGTLNLMTHFISAEGLRIANPSHLKEVAVQAGIPTLINGRIQVAHVA